MEGEVISQEERKRLDRQRFIGWQTQKKLLNSRILITPINGPNTQLAKNLILSGVNVTIYDDAIATEDDFETNFLIAESDIGRLRSQAVFQKLKDMNPSGKNEIFHENLMKNILNHDVSEFKRYTMIATSTNNLEEVAQWDQFTKRLNIPYFNQICCGLHAFAFISLGNEYTYKQINKKDNSVNKIWSINSLPLNDILDWRLADKNKEFIAAIAMMSKAQRNKLIYNPFEADQVVLNNIVEIGVQFVGQKHKQFLKTFAKTYGLDYCPVYSVLGSIISQQVIKIVQNQSQPAMNWLVFNSEQGYGNVVKISKQKQKITCTVKTSK